MKKVLSFLLIVIIITSICLAVPVQGASLDLDTYTAEQIIRKHTDAAKAIQKGFENLQDEILIEDFELTQKTAVELYKSVLLENPEIFYVNPYKLKCAVSVNGGIIIKLFPTYSFAKDVIPDKIKEFNSVMKSLLKGVDDDWSDYKKCRYIHDVVVNCCEYDVNYREGDNNTRTAYGALINNVAVCQGYTLAYNYLLSKVDVEAHFIESHTIKHSWSIVKIKNNYYHVDTTWDDPTSDLPGRVMHTYCLISDKKLSKLEPERKWISNMRATDTSCDNDWWKEIETFIYTVNNKDFYIDHSYSKDECGAFMCYNEKSEKHKCLYKISDRWYDDEKKGNYWQGGYSNLVYDGKLFYFNTPDRIYSIKADGSDRKKYYSPSKLSNDIYGISLQVDGCMYIEARENPMTKGVVIALGKNQNGLAIGDVNLDGKININDVSKIERHLAKLYTLRMKENAHSDYDGNGKLNVKDVTAIQKMLCSIVE